jgi:hypothetical protein
MFIAEEAKERVFALMEKLGIVRIEVTFSGGNDSGGVDSTVAHMADGTEKALPESHYWAKEEEMDDEQALGHLVGEPVHDEWGSFAGDFYVSGTLSFDMAARRVFAKYEEEVPHTDHFDMEL